MLIVTDTDVLVDGGAGTDTVRYGAAVSAENLADADLVNVENVVITNASAASYDFSNQTEALNISGGAAADTITGSSAADTIEAMAGADYLLGNDGNDVFVYTSVAGIINAPSLVAEDATIVGGVGSDTLRLDTGSENVSIDDVTYRYAAQLEVIDLVGNGEIVLNLGNFAGLAFSTGLEVKVNDQASYLQINASGLNVALNLSNGTANGDVISGGSQADTMYGGTGDDNLSGSLGNDVLYGEAGLDTLSGGTGADWLDGGDDDDTLNGDAGNDTLLGGSGDDTLNGGANVDVLTGGTGNDTFYFAGGDIDTTAGAETDVIVDFASANDRIRGSFGAGTETNFVTALSTSDSLAALLSDANSALNGTVKYYVGQVGSDSYLVGDNDGSGYTDVIRLQNVSLGGIAYTSII